MIPIQSIIDVGQQPKLKNALLRGQLNVMTCPACKASGIVGTPLLYHDPARQLLIAFVPIELGLKMEDQERAIGVLTNALMTQIPPENRKAYLLQPRTVFSWDTLIQEILQADGITPEMIEAQNRALQLIHDLLDAQEDGERFSALVGEHQSEIDYDFLLLLVDYAGAIRQDGDAVLADRLLKLREKLVEALGPDEAEPPWTGISTHEDLIARLLEHADRATREEIVTANLPLVDYVFFQTLTGRIEAAQAEGDSDKAAHLTELRSQVLEITDALDRQVQAEFEQAAAALKEILEAPDREKAIRERADQFTPAFMFTLATNISAAREQHREDIAHELEQVQEQMFQVLEERMPPELRLVNQLMREGNKEARQALIDQNRAMFTPRFLELMEALIQDAQEQGQPEVVQRLTLIHEEIKAGRKT
jgi:hypothetical protein